jgi:acyl-CoA thioesterase I
MLLVVLLGCAPPAESPAPSRADVTDTPSTSPTPTAGTSTPSEGTYLALGDSLAVGVGATRPGELGYVGRIAATLAPPSAAKLGVSGETSESLLVGGQLASALEAIQAADPPVSLVTLDIGGNDLLRLLWTEPCASAPATDGCRQLVVATLAAFEANYREALSALVAALDARGGQARLAVMTYFNPFSGTDATHEAAAELALLGADAAIDCERAGAAYRGMNDVIACVGDELGATVVDVHPRFAGLGLELTHIGSDDIHANDLGYEVIADAFLEDLASAE